MSKKSDRGTARPKQRTAVGDQVTKECGCQEQEFSDGTRNIQPCVPHGLSEIAQCLERAGQVMGSVATTLHNIAVMTRANAEVDKGVEDGSID